MKRTILIIAVWIAVCLSINGQITKSIVTNLSDSKIERVGEYDKVFLNKGFNTISIVGHPELPVYVKSYAIPIDAQLTGVTVNGINKHKISGTYNMYIARIYTINSEVLSYKFIKKINYE